jgi:hypothetical protein
MYRDIADELRGRQLAGSAPRVIDLLSGLRARAVTTATRSLALPESADGAQVLLEMPSG